MRRGSLSSELLMCGGAVCSIFVFPHVARDNRCVYMTHVFSISGVMTGKFVV